MSLSQEQAGRPGMPITEQAGGIVLWGDRVVLRLTAERHLVFPKGHLELGESPQQAAVREVQEECGLVARIVDEAGVISFEQGGAVRRVTLYLMTVTGETDELDQHLGVDTFPVPLQWARNLLTFSNTRELLEQVSPRIEAMVAAAER